jgi:hypothetical protein
LGQTPTRKGGVYLFPHTYKTKTKRTIKIRNPNKVLKKPPKKKEDRKLARNNTDK